MKNGDVVYRLRKNGEISQLYIKEVNTDCIRLDEFSYKLSPVVKTDNLGNNYIAPHDPEMDFIRYYLSNENLDACYNQQIVIKNLEEKILNLKNKQVVLNLEGRANIENQNYNTERLIAIQETILNMLSKSFAPKAGKIHYVWLNTKAEDDAGFSNSWDNNIIHCSGLDMFSKVTNVPDSPKLIQYVCLNDNEFEFNKNMKLK